jgi:hypothetical protein
MHGELAAGIAPGQSWGWHCQLPPLQYMTEQAIPLLVLPG